MATAWQTLEEAALTLGISSRTLHRRMARGEFHTRLENGRREVLVTVSVPPSPQAMSDTSATSYHESDRSDTDGQSIEQMSDNVQHTVLALHEARIRRP